MYVDKKRRRWLWGVFAAVAVLLCTGVYFLTVPSSGRDMEEGSITALAEAVERSARQCYVVEGFYPPSLEYLEENYGLQINTDDYRVVYSVFASNLAPSVQVIRRH